MARPFELITANPAAAGFQQSIQQGQQSRQSDQEEILRQNRIAEADRARALDAALAGRLAGPEQGGQGSPSPNTSVPPAPTTGLATAQPQQPGAAIPTGQPSPQPGAAPARPDLVQTLAQGGFGQEAQAAQSAQSAAQDQSERDAFVALAAYGKTGNPGDLANFQNLARNAGLEVPPEIVASATEAGLFATGSLMAEKIYGGSPRQAGTFIKSFLDSDGDFTASAQAAGVPADKPNWTIQNIMQAGQEVLALVDQNSGQVRVPTQPGPANDDGTAGAPAPFEVPASRRGGSGSVPAKIQLAEWLVRNGVAPDRAAAFEMVQAGVQNPLAARTTVFNGVFRSLMTNSLITGMSPEEATAQANKIADDFINEAQQGGDNAADATGQQTANPLPIGQDGRIDRTQLVPNTTYEVNGRMLLFDGQNFQETQ